ncbi:hypothetical protein EG329_011950 [Mollisiaceae sp. DMI_Dod_QoI]|nr:hypothetical protein EG329_011950 [Helotiales sp. DMI_Dod_QoI]
MAPLLTYLTLLLSFSLTPNTFVHAKGKDTTVPSVSPSSTVPSGTSSVPTTTSIPSTPAPSSSTDSAAPDVLLNVPQLSVGRIELDVDNLQADINLNAQVANLVTINAGVQVSVQKINITISDVEAQLELIVRLGHLVDIVQRVFESLDLNPLLITALNDVTSVVSALLPLILFFGILGLGLELDFGKEWMREGFGRFELEKWWWRKEGVERTQRAQKTEVYEFREKKANHYAQVDTVIGAVDGLLGSITQGGTILNFLVDSLGNIVQSVTNTAGQAVDTIVGNYLTNMTFTGVTSNLGNGLTQKQYSYSPLNALVDIVFNSLGQIVGQPTVVKQTSTASSDEIAISGIFSWCAAQDEEEVTRSMDGLVLWEEDFERERKGNFFKNILMW